MAQLSMTLECRVEELFHLTDEPIHDPAFRLIWVHSSSLTALRLLGRGEAHAAGTHLWDQEVGEHRESV